MKLSMTKLWKMIDFCKGHGKSKEHIKRGACTAYKDCPQEKSEATKLFNFAVRAGYIIRCPVIRSNYMANPKVFEVIKHAPNI